jgi:hypothetical protein
MSDRYRLYCSDFIGPVMDSLQKGGSALKQPQKAQSETGLGGWRLLEPVFEDERLRGGDAREVPRVVRHQDRAD